MKRTWTTVGTQIVGAELEDRESVIDKDTVEQAIGTVNWREIPKDGHLEAPMMPGEGIKAAIQTLRIPKVSHVAWSNELAPYGFYGVRGHYKNGQAEVYMVDTGTSIIPVCSDFHEKQETA